MSGDNVAARVHLSMHCLCGVSHELEVHPSDVEFLQKAFAVIHQGEGHGQATAEDAAAARARQRSALLAYVNGHGPAE